MYRKYNDVGESKEGEKNERDEQFMKIEQFDVDLNEATFEHVTTLSKLLNKIYTEVISEKSDAGSVASKKEAMKALNMKALEMGKNYK